jgi:hypothetical protein
MGRFVRDRGQQGGREAGRADLTRLARRTVERGSNAAGRWTVERELWRGCHADDAAPVFFRRACHFFRP